MINIPMNTRPPMSLSDMADAQSTPSATPNTGQPVQQPNGYPQQNYTAQTAQPVNPYTQPNPSGMQSNPQNFGANPAASNSYQTPPSNTFQSGNNPIPGGIPHPQATGVILKKGQKTSLAKFGNALENIDVGLGWDVSNQGVYDLDAECFILGDNEKVLGDDWFVYYNQPASPDGSVRHSGDNRDGSGVGDDEVIHVRLSQVNPQAKKLIFVVTINEARERNLNFSGVQNAYIRLVDQDTKRELCRFNLTEYYSNVTSMMVAELYRHNGEWKMNPIGDGVEADLYDLCIRYGVNVAG
ncbi:MAG: TerD family protein [Lachnospiraceae bacterium]